MQFGEPIDFTPPDGYGGYQPLLIGFILDLRKKNIPLVKEPLVRLINSLQSDDRVYTYSPDDESIPERHGRSVGQISDYNPPIPFPLIKAFRTTLEIIGREDRDHKKYVFYITDNRQCNDDLLECILKENDVKRYGCKILFFGLGCNSFLVYEFQDLFEDIRSELQFR